jgi:DNA polymerase
MRHLHLDVETKALRDLMAMGARKYSECPQFATILLSWAWDNEPVQTLDMYHEPYPGYMLQRFAPDVLDALRTKFVGLFLIWAWNAPFEMITLAKYLGIELTAENWRCAMVAAGYLGLPRKLSVAAKALNLEQLKDTRGTTLINMFSVPQKTPKKRYDFAQWITPEMAPAEWIEYKQYNAQDVVVEREIVHYCMQYPGPSDTEWLYWRQNEVVNARGMFIDVPFVNACIEVCATYMEGVRTEFEALTGGLNPKSGKQVKDWAASQGVDLPSLNKDYLTDNVDPALLPANVARMLELRAAASKTSISKYGTMLDYLCNDGRIHDQIQHYGADTGRYAGRGVQPHNLTKTFSNEDIIKRNAKRLGVPLESIEALVGNALETAKDAITCGAGALIYRDVTAIVGKLQRTAIVAAPGNLLVPSDYSSIEAIMLAWVAGEEWALEVFRTHGKIYEATAARMFGIAIEDVTGEQRGKGKRATLALGYQGWTGAMITSGALRAGMTEAELPKVCGDWRKANPAIAAPAKVWHHGVQRDNPNPGLWARLEHAALYTVSTKTAYMVKLPYCEILFTFEGGNMFITLPSGRRLCYHNAQLAGGELRYYGLRTIPGTTQKIWGPVNLYGGLITENIIQAMARDCLAWAMDVMHRDGADIVLHVHDEIVVECLAQLAPEVLAYMEMVMRLTPHWAKGLPISAKGFITPFYCKE